MHYREANSHINKVWGAFPDAELRERIKGWHRKLGTTQGTRPRHSQYLNENISATQNARRHTLAQWGKDRCCHRWGWAANLGLGSLPHGDRWQAEEARMSSQDDRVRRIERSKPWTGQRQAWEAAKQEVYCPFPPAHTSARCCPATWRSQFCENHIPSSCSLLPSPLHVLLFSHPAPSYLAPFCPLPFPPSPTSIPAPFWFRFSSNHTPLC